MIDGMFIVHVILIERHASIMFRYITVFRHDAILCHRQSTACTKMLSEKMLSWMMIILI